MTTLTVIKTPEGNERLKQLKKVVEMIEIGFEMVEPTRITLEEYGIEANVHVGKQKDNPSYFDNQQYLCEYFMGQILNIIESQAWFAMNSGLNTIYSYLERVEKEGGLCESIN